MQSLVVAGLASAHRVGNLLHVVGELLPPGVRQRAFDRTERQLASVSEKEEIRCARVYYVQGGRLRPVLSRVSRRGEAEFSQHIGDGVARLRRPPGQVRLNALPKRRDSAECGTGYARRVSRCRAEVRLRLGWDKHAAGHALDELDAGPPAPPTAAFTADPGIDGLGRWGRAHLLELGRGELQLVPLLAEGVGERTLEGVHVDKAALVHVVRVEQDAQVEAARAHDRAHPDERVHALCEALVVKVDIVSRKVPRPRRWHSLGHGWMRVAGLAF